MGPDVHGYSSCLAYRSILAHHYLSPRASEIPVAISLFTLVARLFTGVWLPTWVERVSAPRRRCPVATTSCDNGRKPGRTRDEYLSASSGVVGKGRTP
ncbi:hypothetical protein BD311DRAFT_753848 [Dichomitus squalens]|uniref:Uncharacterized protein n=1 Tax=Dichomitus squalens TaxID=114155 RepID=A0A4Q9MTY5_9APHY|nr:hypothetical protein BD311DRAFT_753848 [Dichomitus squalens]